MSLTASFVAVTVIITRLLLKKAPKIFSYALWAIVLFRLVCPFTFESPLSLIPSMTNAIPQDIVYSQNPTITTQIEIIDNAVNQSIQASLPAVNPAASVNPMEIFMEIAKFIWMLGVLMFLSYGVISYFRLKHKLLTASLVKNNIYETDRIQTPFVLGIIKPRIFIPIGLAGTELDYILIHEKTHIKHYDYIIKPLAFLIISIHWFNPLMWLSYFLMIKDMEMSCDESVMKQSNEDIRINYSNSLLSLSGKQSGLLFPLAFGESNTKSRIKNVLNYRKSAFLVILFAVIILTVVAVGLMTNQKEKANFQEDIQLRNSVIEIETNMALTHVMKMSYDELTNKTEPYMYSYYKETYFDELKRAYETRNLVPYINKPPYYQYISKVYSSNDNSVKHVFIKSSEISAVNLSTNMPVEGKKSQTAKKYTFKKENDQWKISSVNNYILSIDINEPKRIIEMFANYNNVPIEYESIKTLDSLNNK
jgi:beta-lactamase regulating signal transducer with metallopeptidase domain